MQDTFLLTNLVFLLSLFTTAINATVVNDAGDILVARQDTAQPPPPAAAVPENLFNLSAVAFTDPGCLDYAQTANLSTIGSNSTLRSAFLQLSPQGTVHSVRLLDAAVKKFPPMMANPALIALCGNFTGLALAESERNFSQGIVGPFSGLKGNPQFVQAGPEVLVLGVIAPVIILILSMLL